MGITSVFQRLRKQVPEMNRLIGKAVMTPALILFVPSLSLLAYVFGGQPALLAVALGLPLLVAAIGTAPAFRDSNEATSHHNPTVLPKEKFEQNVREIMALARSNGLRSAVFHLVIDDYEEVISHFGESAADNLKRQLAGRLRSKLRANDALGVYGENGFSVCLAAQPFMDLEICLEMASRFARSVSEPYSVGGTSIYVTGSIGFCQSGRETAQQETSERDALSECAAHALTKALAAAPAAIRAYTADTRALGTAPQHPQDQNPVQALELGEIVPWFQPQISTDTGKVSGFETLARWMHPERGILSPAAFLDDLEAANAMNRLSEVMVQKSLAALKSWDDAGIEVPRIGVNFASAELSDPNLVDKIRWELDRFDLGPDRLTVEILETVVSQGPDDVITRNIKGLNDIGCQIDLDDFGTGHASLASIRRFGVSRIKIDRSFVMKADQDPEQQRMIKAILTMAEKLNLDTLAEGVETAGVHSLLAQLGCSHVQGFGIARPMPLEETFDWLRAHNAQIMSPPEFGRTAK